VKKLCGIALALMGGSATTLKAQNIYMVGNHTVGEYGLDGSTNNASLISGLDGVSGIAISRSDMFLAGGPAGGVEEYTTSGVLVNASLISNLANPVAIAISGNDLFIVNQANGTIGEYTTSGVTVNGSLVDPAGLSWRSGIAVLGTNLFVVNDDSGTVGEYTTSGTTVSASLISGLAYPWGIAISPPSAPVLSSPGFSNGLFQMTVTGPANQISNIQMTTNLPSTNWILLLVTNPPSTSFLFTDPDATNEQRFYRVEVGLFPQPLTLNSHQQNNR
jgi:hypothetical protein